MNLHSVSQLYERATEAGLDAFFQRRGKEVSRVSIAALEPAEFSRTFGEEFGWIGGVLVVGIALAGWTFVAELCIFHRRGIRLKSSTNHNNAG